MPESTRSEGLTPIQRIRKAFDEWDTEAVQHQQRRLRFARWTVLLGPAATIALIIQTVWCNDLELCSYGLIGFELALLVTMLVLDFGAIGPSRDQWIDDRLRAEVLRREEFLA